LKRKRIEMKFISNSVRKESRRSLGIWTYSASRCTPTSSDSVQCITRYVNYFGKKNLSDTWNRSNSNELLSWHWESIRSSFLFSNLHWLHMNLRIESKRNKS
jgi:hypothetical protein